MVDKKQYTRQIRPALTSFSGNQRLRTCYRTFIRRLYRLEIPVIYLDVLTMTQLEPARFPRSHVRCCGREDLRDKPSGTRRSDFQALALAVFLGLASFATILASQNITDADLWAKLALGAHVW